jgi:hypothetical protein
MIESRASALKKLKTALSRDQKWCGILASVDALVQVHLAVFVEPYLTFIANGQKTIETRFSKKCIAPFESVEKGDIVLLKRPGGGVAGVCLVEKVWFYNLTAGSVNEIRERFGKGICPANAAFWDERRDAAYCSLIWVTAFRSLEDLPFQKSDRRGWAILK